MDNRTRGKRIFVVVAALFVVPLAIAFLLYYGSDWRPGGATNHGKLIHPAHPLPPAGGLSGFDGTPYPAGGTLLRGKWTLLYVGGGLCNESCRHALVTMRQTRLALANDMNRVQRVFLATAPCCDAEYVSHEHPGLIALDASGAGTRELLQHFPPADRPDGIFVVDPLGNLMMRFDARQDPHGLLADLRKLLSLSHIG
jgi:cytochrome oxidase Cu insertion factor (SCO1/SenC/PrrC family)